MFHKSHAVTGMPVPSITTATFTLSALAEAGYDGPIKFSHLDGDSLYVIGRSELDKLLAADPDSVPPVKTFRAAATFWNGWHDALGIGEDEFTATLSYGRAIMEQISEWFIPVRLADYHPTRHEIDCRVVFGLPHLPVQVQVFTGDVYEGTTFEGIPGPRLAKQVTA